jgi:hypothetical protein
MIHCLRRVQGEGKNKEGTDLDLDLEYHNVQRRARHEEVVTHGVEGERYGREREASEETAVAEVIAGVQQQLRWCCGAAPLDVGAGDNDLQ